MNRNHRPALVLAAGIASAAVAGGLYAQGGAPGGAPGAAPDPVRRTVLVRSDLQGLDGKEAVLFLAELAPGAVGARHFHPGTEVFYVVDGTFVHEPQGGPPLTLRAGEAAANPFRGVHAVRNGSPTEPARVVGCLVTEKGQPLSVPAH
jgi:quercetin dioxygenase-like cupin family protein